jgi:hypothetical protein
MKKLDDDYSSEELRDLIDEELADAPDGSAFIATAFDEDEEPVLVVGVKDAGRVGTAVVNLTEKLLKEWCLNLGYHVERVQ